MGHPTETLRDAEMIGAIAGLEKMVAAGTADDLEAKAALAATCYTVSAKSKGVAWAEEHIGPIIRRLREHPNASAEVETILHGLPDRARLEEAIGLGAALDALLAPEIERYGSEASESVDRLTAEVRHLRTELAAMRSLVACALPVVRYVAGDEGAAPDLREAARRWERLAEPPTG